MTFQDQMFENASELRARATALANAAAADARLRVQVTAKRLAAFKGSLAALSAAGRELKKVARRHALEFVKKNSSIAAAARKDVTALARTTYSTITQREVATKQAVRRKPAARKRAKSKTH